jgi:outer membrane lipoprotein-sorting protein
MTTIRACLVSIALVAGPVAAAGKPLTAGEIMDKNFVVLKVIDSVADADFILTNKTGQSRVRKTASKTKLEPNAIDNMRMVRFNSPPDVKGTVVLTIEHDEKDDDMWIFLPGLKKVRRLVSTNKKDSFVGTDFSYGDVIGHKPRQWNHQILKEEPVDKAPCWVIESTPKDDNIKSSSGYSKVQRWIRKDNFVSVKEEYWDYTGQKLKTMIAADIQEVDHARHNWQPMKMTMTNQQTEHNTVIQLKGFLANQKVSDDFFTTRYMERDQ